MFILWGWRIRKHEISAGQFHCQSCAADAPYKLVEPRRWFTLFFIPVIPLDRQDRYVECAKCGGAYTEAAANIPAAR